jgi:hypothetical protein
MATNPSGILTLLNPKNFSFADYFRLKALEHGDKEWGLAEWFTWRNLIIGWM